MENINILQGWTDEGIPEFKVELKISSGEISVLRHLVSLQAKRNKSGCSENWIADLEKLRKQFIAIDDTIFQEKQEMALKRRK